MASPRLFALALLLGFAPLAAELPMGLLPAGPRRAEVPVPDLGARYTSHAATLAYLRALAAAAPDRVKLLTLSVTEEGREQPLLIISSPGNLRRLDELKALNARLADPRTCPEPDARRLVETHPAFVWLGYSIHGAEASGSEAALAVAYHFASATRPEVLQQLDQVVLLVAPVQNPDGRDRHGQAVAEVSTPFNASDPQDAQNTPRWPGGRFNHRLFDLNRDWVWQTQGETRALAGAFLQWNPQVAADHHEMWAESSYYVPPTMQPIHEALPAAQSARWQAVFGGAVARAFDARGWAYFSRDVFDLFYPGYGDSWPTFQGAVGMTFEVAGQGGLAYRRLDGEVLTLEDRIRRHTTASLATVATAAAQRQALLWDFQQTRRERLALGDRAGAFLLAEGDDPGRAWDLAALLQRNGIEVRRTAEALGTQSLVPVGFTAGDSVPPGSLLVRLDQPRGALAQALLEADGHMGPRPTFDVTAWSLPITFQVPAWFARTAPKVATAPLLPAEPPALPQAAWGYLIPSGHEGVERTLAALLADGIKVSALAEPAQVKGQHLGAGTLVLPIQGNAPGLHDRLDALRQRHHHPILATDTAQMTAGPDLGSNRMLVLKAPRIAVLMDRPANPMALGAVLHTLTEAGLPFTQLRTDRLAAASMARYTHLVLVDDGAQGKAWQQALGEPGTARLKAWLAEGGMLLACQGGAAYASRAGLTPTGFHLLTRAAEASRLKEKDPKREIPPRDPADLVRPWAAREAQALEESIPGAFLKVRVDPSHPLAWGLHGGPEGAVLDANDLILELSQGGENPLFHPKEPLKVSGLLPPAMDAKVQQTAYALREKVGRGALILVAGDPLFRAQTPFTRRLFFNALFFGAYRPVLE